MTRIRLAGPDLVGLGALPGQTVQLLVPRRGGDDTARRDYTVRHFDDTAGTMDIDFVLHPDWPDGPAATWARRAEPGQAIAFLGPSGRLWQDATADWHLFAGDESAVPAILAMAEALPADTVAWLYLEVADADEEQPVHGPAVPYWIHRGAAEPGTSTVLADAVAATRLPAGRGRVWLAGHTATARAIRTDLLGREVVERRGMYVRGFWGARTEGSGPVRPGG